jgi:hypothetical protein
MRVSPDTGCCMHTAPAVASHPCECSSIPPVQSCDRSALSPSRLRPFSLMYTLATLLLQIVLEQNDPGSDHALRSSSVSDRSNQHRLVVVQLYGSRLDVTGQDESLDVSVDGCALLLVTPRAHTLAVLSCSSNRDRVEPRSCLVQAERRLDRSLKPASVGTGRFPFCSHLSGGTRLRGPGEMPSIKNGTAASSQIS